MPKTEWKPTRTTWSQLAHHETVEALGAAVSSRAIAVCAWSLANNPDATLADVEAVASADVDIPRHKAGKKIDPDMLRQARRILGLSTPKKKRAAPRKSRTSAQVASIEKAILAQFHKSMELVAEYARTTGELAAARQAFEAAREALRAMPRDQAQTLADADTTAGEILAREGVLAEARSESAGDAWQGSFDDSPAADARVPVSP
ncbi:MAG TPA: hypothetical protein VFZ65_08900 [Planctomycetota bacterium]|nr:hypothetical protein [Planctomycetota bacterium]